MRGFSLLFLFLALAGPTARASAAPGFDSALSQQVYTAALRFIAPRALEPVTVPQLTLWGLRGITALDPELTVTLRSGHVVLAARRGVILSLLAPLTERAADWASLAATVQAAAVARSAALRRAGTQGMIGAFFDEMFDHMDPYSRYVPPPQAAADEAARGGGPGIGLRLARRAGRVVAGRVTPGGPAARAGLRPGAQIVTLNGQPVSGQRIAALQRRLAGPEGSAVRLRWIGPRGKPHAATILRRRVPPPSVTSTILAGMLLVRIERFNRATDSGFAAAVEQGLATTPPPDGIVLDLRGDPGGLLAQAVAVADGLLGAGVVARTEGRDKAADTIWRSAPGELAKGLPVVVLVDGRTASAAEILAAALADRGRAVVVGSSTFGKGLVQRFTRLPGGGELFLTWSRVLAPRGWPLQGVGVLPQVCTSLGLRAVERQLGALEEGVQPMLGALVAERRLRAPVPPAEALAVRAGCPAAVGQELDLEVAHYLIDHPAAYAAALLPPMREKLTMPGPGGAP